jgi:hypothetical protein
MPKGLTKRSEQLEVRELPENELLVYDYQFRTTHFLGTSTALIWDRCNGVNSRADLEKIVQVELNVMEPRAAVREAISRLSRLNLLLR